MSDRAGLRAAKRAMRAQMRERRESIPADERGRLAAEIEERLFALPVVRAAGTLMLFASFGSEVPTAGMLERAWSEGHLVALPALRGGGIRVFAIHPGQPLVPSGYGPLEPPEDEPVPIEEIDVVVAPGLAFDRRGDRLGYGAGHYDRLIDQLAPSARTIGVGFHDQLVEAVPHGGSDRPLDAVVTDREVVICAPATGR